MEQVPDVILPEVPEVFSNFIYLIYKGRYTPLKQMCVSFCTKWIIECQYEYLWDKWSMHGFAKPLYFVLSTVTPFTVLQLIELTTGSDWNWSDRSLQTYFSDFILLQIVWSLVRRRVTRPLTRLQTFCFCSYIVWHSFVVRSILKSHWIGTDRNWSDRIGKMSI